MFITKYDDFGTLQKQASLRPFFSINETTESNS